jgi:cytochrome c biogenesis DsbD-like protein
MSMRKISILAVLLLPTLWSCAQGAMKGSGDVVDVYPVAASVSAAGGERIQFDIKLNIQKKWHLYAHEDSMFIGVDLVPGEGFPLEDFQAEYPIGEEGEFFGEKVVMISGKSVIHASALVPANMTPGKHPLSLAVTVQACDNKTCLAPAYLPVALTLTVK